MYFSETRHEKNQLSSCFQQKKETERTRESTPASGSLPEQEEDVYLYTHLPATRAMGQE